jgi:hypothetical protein
MEKFNKYLVRCRYFFRNKWLIRLNYYIAENSEIACSLFYSEFKYIKELNHNLIVRKIIYL